MQKLLLEALEANQAAAAIGDMTPINSDVVKARFKHAGLAVPNDRKAQAVAEALPSGAATTGDSPLEVLDMCIANRANGAVKRLLQLHRDMTRGQAKQRQRAGRGQDKGKTTRPPRGARAKRKR